MFRRLMELVTLASIAPLVAIACAFLQLGLGLSFQAAFPEIGKTPAPGVETEPRLNDYLVIMDWDAGISHYVSLNHLRTGERTPATRVPREDLADLPIHTMAPMNDDGRRYLLRDTVTRRLHPANGIWCWSLSDGTVVEMIDGQQVIDVVFDDTPE